MNRPAGASADFVGESAVDVAALVAGETLPAVFVGDPRDRNDRDYDESRHHPRKCFLGSSIFQLQSATLPFHPEDPRLPTI